MQLTKYSFNFHLDCFGLSASHSHSNITNGLAMTRLQMRFVISRQAKCFNRKALPIRRSNLAYDFGLFAMLHCQHKRHKSSVLLFDKCLESVITVISSSYAEVGECRQGLYIGLLLFLLLLNYSYAGIAPVNRYHHVAGKF